MNRVFMKVGYLYFVACLFLPVGLFSSVPEGISWKKLVNPFAFSVQDESLSGHDSYMQTMINNGLMIGVVKGCQVVLIGFGTFYVSRSFYDYRYIIYGIGSVLMAPSLKWCTEALAWVYRLRKEKQQRDLMYK